MFQNRTAAGRELALALARYRGQPNVIFALPHGGVVLGAEIARFLEAPLDLIVVRKIGHPQQPEFAIGAVAEDGEAIRNPAEPVVQDSVWFNRAAELAKAEAHRQRELFLGNRNPIPVQEKNAIIVDDGVATGYTMLAAIREIRKKSPQRIIVAVPVAAPEIAERIRHEVDDLVVLHIPHWLSAVGAFYDEFDQVSDKEVIRLMQVPLPTGEGGQRPGEGA